jgi:cytidine deaminase
MHADMDEGKQKQLVEMEVRARDVAENAYCPYSRFYVGCSVLADNGKIYSGCNLENAAYGSTICAEANAISTAFADGAKEIKAIVIFTPTDIHTYPCGNCRQILNEVAANIPIYSICNASEIVCTDLATILPNNYGPRNLYSSSKEFVL